MNFTEIEGILQHFHANKEKPTDAGLILTENHACTQGVIRRASQAITASLSIDKDVIKGITVDDAERVIRFEDGATIFVSKDPSPRVGYNICFVWLDTTMQDAVARAEQAQAFDDNQPGSDPVPPVEDDGAYLPGKIAEEVASTTRRKRRKAKAEDDD